MDQALRVQAQAEEEEAMTLDPGPLAEHAAFVIDEVIGDFGEDVELTDAVITVEIRDHEDETSTVVAYSMSKRNVTTVGILARGLWAAINPDIE